MTTSSHTRASHTHVNTHMHACIHSMFRQSLSEMTSHYVTGIIQQASQSVSELCFSYIKQKDDLTCIYFQFILLDLQMSSLVSAALFPSLWVSMCVPISSDLIHSLTGFSIVRGGGIYLFFSFLVFFCFLYSL